MLRTVLLSSIATCALAWAPAAHAQDAGQAPVVEEPEAQAEEGGLIVVTGSRIARQDFQSPSPIVTIGTDTLTSTPSVNIESTLNQLPQFAQGQSQSAIGAVANGGRATLNLRGLGETRNLILLDGRRLPLSSAFGVVDINNIAPGILESVETISGGASAVYGSDAISGVVNFRTRRDFEGIQLDARYGQSFQGDAGTFDISGTGGIRSADGRGSAMLSLSYSRRNVLWGHERSDFFGLGVLSSFISTGTYVPSATNLPQQAVVNSVFAGYGVAAGTVPNSRSLGFNDDGTLFSQVGAVNYKGPTTNFYSTFGGTVRQPVAMQEYIVQPMERYNVFGKVEYELNDGLTAYGQILHTNTRVTGQVGWSPTVFVIPTMPVTNPFIPAALATVLASRPSPTADFTLNSRFTGFEDRKFHADVNTTQFIVGLRGDIAPGWSFDIYGLHDSVDMVETQDKALLLSRMRTLLYAADGGASICAGGFNPFGIRNQESVSRACRDYIEARTHDYTRTTQDIIEGNITGKLFPLPGGDVRFSLTGTYRENSFEYDPDPSRENNDIIGTLGSVPAAGSLNVKEIAGELLVPLLRDMPFAESLEFNLGYRYSDYNVTGSFSTYRIEGSWRPITPLLIRGGYERAIRAPNIGELYSSAQTAQAQIGSPPGAGDPCDVRSSARSGANATQMRALCIATGVPSAIVDTYQYTTVAIGTVSSGSTALKPETADTITFGAVLRSPFNSPWTSGFSLSVDYYDIRISDVISQVSGVTTMNKCYNLDGSNPTYAASNLYCQLIRRDGTGGINTVSTPYLNLGGLRTSGIDIQADWKVNLADAGIMPGTLNVNLVVNFLNSYEVQILPGAAFVDYSGTIDGTQAATTPPVGLPLPKSKIFTSVGYSVGPVQAGLRWRHLPAMSDVTAVTRPASPAAGVPAYDIFDLSLGVQVTDKVRLSGGISNLFDVAPLQIAGTPGLTQPGTYDIIGRSFFVSLSSRF
ncbi:TonB-dependent receptor [Sphingomonas sp. AOB5]|uniref:TonB-dependent receptor domain-containing protein n=1 Tax=Sphingomonas sp. AOB5 TaxID=3034017 RepID=UPI0023F63517|nr:TonB-dependent receptor [Sphingomonas sp. AOB5]MDF7775599.1 TonB-dependent receptor [Sphingomonas sp. AOB5]